MKICVEFDSWEEMNGFCAKQAEKAAAEITTGLCTVEMPEQTETPAEELPVGDPIPKGAAEMPEPEEAPFEEKKEEKPAIVLADIQKAVRQLVKAKGKETAKEVLGRFGAASASTLDEKFYAEATEAIREVLNA